jgi:hypothetical protein
MISKKDIIIVIFIIPLIPFVALLLAGLAISSNWITYGGLLLLAAIVILSVFLVRRPRMKHGEILSAQEMKEKYGVIPNNYRPPKINPENVPETLHDLVPLAIKWGIADDIMRSDFEQKASEEEKQELKSAMAGRTADINSWLNSFENGKPMSDEAACFMYMLEAVDEMKLWPDT